MICDVKPPITWTTVVGCYLYCAVSCLHASTAETQEIVSQVSEPKYTESHSVPEPSSFSLVALAFAGVVILARHRFKPS